MDTNSNIYGNSPNLRSRAESHIFFLRTKLFKSHTIQIHLNCSFMTSFIFLFASLMFHFLHWCITPNLKFSSLLWFTHVSIFYLFQSILILFIHEMFKVPHPSSSVFLKNFGMVSATLLNNLHLQVSNTSKFSSKPSRSSTPLPSSKLSKIFDTSFQVFHNSSKPSRSSYFRDPGHHFPNFGFRVLQIY